MNRRKFLQVIGGGTILAATGMTAFLSTRTPARALAPWDQAGTLYKEPRRKALSYAVLAPNPHNRQPWLVDLSMADEVTLYADTQRLLPHTDPFDRQITIGLGCFLELMRMAGQADGYRVEWELFPQGADPKTLDHRPVARARFIASDGVKADPLFEHVLKRRSLKEPFDLDRPVPRADLTAIAAAAVHGSQTGIMDDPGDVASMRQLTHDALAIEIDTPHTFKESVDLFRIGKREVEANPDGIDFSGPLFETLALTGQFSRELALDRNSAAFKEGQKAVFANTDTAMAYVWQITSANSREDQIRAGQDWLRINLAATALGAGIQPLSQALQEYPEMTALYKDIHARLAPAGGTIQMLGRLGYGKTVRESPRWPLAAKIMKA